MAINNLTAYQSKIYQLFFSMFFLFLGFLVVRRMLFSGSVKAGYMICAIIVAAIVLLLLDKLYWLCLPVISILKPSIPGVPFDGVELGCLSLVATYGMRMALHRDKVSFSINEAIPAVGLCLWMAAVFALNPVGFAKAGSATMGGRFYFKVFLSFFTFLAMSSIHISEKDAKILFWCIFFSSAVSLVTKVFNFAVDRPSTVPEGFLVEANSNYSFIGFGFIFLLLFSKWSLTDILSSPFKFVVMFILAALSVYSGKRQAFGQVLLLPILRCVLLRKDVAATIVVSIFAAFAILFAVSGDGHFYSLPKSAKRALAVVSPKYAEETAGGIHDIFRESLRTEAFNLVHHNPWFGRKGFAMSAEETAWMYLVGKSDASSVALSGHAYAGNWHNMWLAYACDFGIPGLLFALVLWFHVIKCCFSAPKEVVCGKYLPVCCLVYSIQLIFQFAFAWWNGHASLSTVDVFTTYGMLLAIINGYRMNMHTVSSRCGGEIPSSTEHGINAYGSVRILSEP